MNEPQSHGDHSVSSKPRKNHDKKIETYSHFFQTSRTSKQTTTSTTTTTVGILLKIHTGNTLPENMDSDQEDDFAARDNNSQQDNVSQDMFDDEDLSNHNAAAIDSIVERMEADPPNLDVDDLQDDVDLGLDVIETASNDDGSRPSSPSVINNEHSSEINNAESHRPESPQDIEFQDEKPESAEFAAATADIYSRRVELRLERLRIGSNCYVKGSRVDLYKLKEASPGLFKNVKLGVKRDKDKEKKSKKDDKKEKERKKSSDKKEKKEKKPKPATSTKIVSLALISSDSDSDSDLEEMKKRLMKPGVISSSTSKQIDIYYFTIYV